MKNLLYLVPIAMALLSSTSHAQVSLVGAELYFPPTADGTVTPDANLEYTTNASNSGFGPLDLTLGSDTQTDGVLFDLSPGANIFTFSTAGGDQGDYGGLELFFAPTTGPSSGSLNPTDTGYPADLSITIPLNGVGGSPTVPAAGTVIQDYGVGNSTTIYSGATSYELAGKIITLSDVSATDSSSGGFTVNVNAAPEPSTWALMFVGFGGLCALGRYARVSA